MDIFARRLKELREEMGISQYSLAVKTGMSKRTISRWEQGDAMPNIEYIKVLCEFFGCTADYLIGLEE